MKHIVSIICVLMTAILGVLLAIMALEQKSGKRIQTKYVTVNLAEYDRKRNGNQT